MTIQPAQCLSDKLSNEFEFESFDSLMLYRKLGLYSEGKETIDEYINEIKEMLKIFELEN